MATTTNYGWTTPNDTDLVKDGAAAIRTLGSSVDTTTKALNPSTTLGDIEYRSSTANTNTRLAIGTTGQVLTVAGGVPTWATSDDANAIQNAIIDAKGDLIVGTAADTPGRLAVGTNNYVLTADSAEATGMKWAALATGTTFVGCSLYKNANQTISNATNTAISFQVESYDTDAFHDNSTNNTRITIPAGKAGKYLVTGSIAWSTGANERVAMIYKNGSLVNYMHQMYPDNAGGYYAPFNYVINLAVGDYIELFCYQGSGGNLSVYNGLDLTTFQASYLGA